jgi:2-oxoglutarate dehydrogenase E1 component
MLRHPDASSPIEDFARQRFLNVLPDTGLTESEVRGVSRILLCTGKIGHELRAERRKRKDTLNAIVFVEQIYPFPEKELERIFAQYPSAREIVWVQEEPANMGALFYVLPRLRRIAGERSVLSVKRSASASPATGSAKAHEVEQKTLVTLALTTKS